MAAAQAAASGGGVAEWLQLGLAGGLAGVLALVLRWILGVGREVTKDVREQAAEAIGHAEGERDHFISVVRDLRAELTQVRYELRAAERRSWQLERWAATQGLDPPPPPQPEEPASAGPDQAG